MGDSWACDCKTLQNLAVSGEFFKAKNAVKTCLGNTFEERETVSDDYLEKCKKSNNEDFPQVCCRNKRNFFGHFWPLGSKCNCKGMAGNYTAADMMSIEDRREELNRLRTTVLQCIQKAEEQSESGVLFKL